ncbi:serine acetyltransferase [Pelobium manganitolerans]|uniref:Serine acetyltransferase n=1 Tax=Pelobium manganitolerans TaxID=1842495 RepID=A0A419S9K4_9SPHI|nr:serine O-acetyltransferase EpsC [Pelobium manganitolerans]RKD18694.1 serine acetyltransferase [Pelobium manganitolerans]
MNIHFLQSLYQRQQRAQAIPANEEIANWALSIIGLLFPELSDKIHNSVKEIEEEFDKLELELNHLLDATQACKDCHNEAIAKQFIDSLPHIYATLKTDISALNSGDPAASDEFEVIRTYPGFWAIAFYRIANSLLLLKTPLIPRILTEYAHSKTGIDIHPGAKIGEYLCIDHGTGIVIGETTIIGKHVKLYQGVTLGALSVSKTLAGVKRHPTVEDNVVIYSGATILGGETVIGANSIIGGNVWLTKSVPANSTVYHTPSIKVIENSNPHIS